MHDARSSKDDPVQPPAAPRGPHAVSRGILLIEASPPEIARFRYALQEHVLPYPLMFLTAGSEVRDFVRRAAPAAALWRPQLIITESQLPGMELDEIVAAVRGVPAYQEIPLLLFSSVAAAEGLRRDRQCGVTAFIPKPRNWQALVSAVASMVRRWGGEGDNRNTARERETKGEKEPSTPTNCA